MVENNLIPHTWVFIQLLVNESTLITILKSIKHISLIEKVQTTTFKQNKSVIYDAVCFPVKA